MVNSKMVVALTVGIFLFVITLLAAWRYRWDENKHLDYHTPTRILIKDLHDSVVSYKKKTGAYPKDLSVIDSPQRWARSRRDDGTWWDRWGHPLEYQVKDNGFELKSLGRDGAVGGDSLELDIKNDPSEIEIDYLSLSEFAEESVSRGYFHVAAATGVVAFLFMMVAAPNAPKKYDWIKVLIVATFTMIVSLVGGGILMLLCLNFLDHH